MYLLLWFNGLMALYQVYYVLSKEPHVMQKLNLYVDGLYQTFVMLFSGENYHISCSVNLRIATFVLGIIC